MWFYYANLFYFHKIRNDICRSCRIVWWCKLLLYCNQICDIISYYHFISCNFIWDHFTSSFSWYYVMSCHVSRHLCHVTHAHTSRFLMMWFWFNREMSLLRLSVAWFDPKMCFVTLWLFVLLDSFWILFSCVDFLCCWLLCGDSELRFGVGFSVFSTLRDIGRTDMCATLSLFRRGSLNKWF